MAKKKEPVEMALEVEETTELVLDDLVDDELSLEIDDDVDTMGLETLDEVPEPSLEPSRPKMSAPLSEIEGLITDIDDSIHYLTWVIYGKNGTGKTTLLSTADGVLILAAEDGTLSIKDKAKGKAKKLKIDTWEKLEAVYWLLKDGKWLKDKDGNVTGIEISTKTGKFVVRYLAIDTVTKLAEVCMRNVVLGSKAKDIDRDVIKRTMRDWGDMSEKMKYWIQQFEELPIQRVWTFQESSNSEDVESDEFSIFPAVNKSLRTYVLSEADIIARTYIAKTEKGVQYRISAAPNANYVTKDRTSTLNKGAIANPSLEKLYQLVFETK